MVTNDGFLLESYQSSIDLGEITADLYQREIILELQLVFDQLVQEKAVVESGKSWHYFTQWIAHLIAEKPSEPTIKGLYIWGGVGRGKTYLVDLFYKLLPIEDKLRLHFHRFMQRVHEELANCEGIANPLQTVANNLAGKIRLLCLDEIHINDITDAMLLATLFEHLFDLDVVVVMTSNVPPKGLYKDGALRERFEPAIKLLEKYTKVVKIQGNIDYRLNILSNGSTYYLLDNNHSDTASEQYLEHYFHQLSGIELHQERVDIVINNRHIPVKMWADGVVWFSFDELCNTPRSPMDYSQIALFFHTVLISDIPIMDNTMNDIARRFINLIGMFYDMHTNIVVSAFAEPESLYTGTKLAFEFQRIASRLREMQSEDYIKARHFSVVTT